MQSTTPVDEQTTINRSYSIQPRSGQSRDRSLSSVTSNKSNTTNITVENSTTIDSSKFYFYFFFSFSFYCN